MNDNALMNMFSLGTLYRVRGIIYYQVSNFFWLYLYFFDKLFFELYMSSPSKRCKKIWIFFSLFIRFYFVINFKICQKLFYNQYFLFCKKGIKIEILGRWKFEFWFVLKYGSKDQLLIFTEYFKILYSVKSIELFSPCKTYRFWVSKI